MDRSPYMGDDVHAGWGMELLYRKCTVGWAMESVGNR